MKRKMHVYSSDCYAASRILTNHWFRIEILITLFIPAQKHGRFISYTENLKKKKKQTKKTLCFAMEKFKVCYVFSIISTWN